MSRETLPEGDAPIGAVGQDPGVRGSFGLGAHTHIGIQAEAQQEAAQQGGVVLTVPLQGHGEEVSSKWDLYYQHRVYGLDSPNLKRRPNATYTALSTLGWHTVSFSWDAEQAPKARRENLATYCILS